VVTITMSVTALNNPGSGEGNGRGRTADREQLPQVGRRPITQQLGASQNHNQETEESVNLKMVHAEVAPATYSRAVLVSGTASGVSWTVAACTPSPWVLKAVGTSTAGFLRANQRMTT
jgi:hypothetical protein